MIFDDVPKSVTEESSLENDKNMKSIPDVNSWIYWRYPAQKWLPALFINGNYISFLSEKCKF